MAKVKTRYVCQNCGRITPAFMGKCPQCGEFGTMVEEVIQPATSPRGSRLHAPRPLREPQTLNAIEAENFGRYKLSISELSRVLGGGIVPSSLVLLGGDPGIGKSTLLLQAATIFANQHGKVLYVSGEESVHQIKMRADRMDLRSEALFLVTETNLQSILQHITQQKPLLVIIDSIQTTYTDDLNSAPGSVSQVRECATRLQETAKGSNVTVFIVGHVTKEGTIAGPRVLEHIVDTVLQLQGDPFHRYRLLRSVKNRFGATSEVGVFEMHAKGMVEVPNPSEAFLAERQINASGSAIAVTIEGTRPLLVEIQALASSTSFSNPRRTANGVDYNRLLLLSAVLTKRVKLHLYDKDIFVNVVGGLEIDEPAADLAVAVAIASSSRDRPVHADMAFIGEIGLSGELRAVSQLETRLREASKLGFKRCLVPLPIGRRKPEYPKGLKINECRTLKDALAVALVPE
ncbi:MAG: DNA repair protein RadA [Ardenticatenaceae bacterium]|nr:DNA repair protein RadA [Ardenticatenaceae bacterium]